MPRNPVPSPLQHVRRLAAAGSSDEQLLADFRDRRSEDAFAALLGRHGPMVLNVCRRVLHDDHAAEDVFQATFLVLAGRAAAVRRPAALAGFLHGVAYRLAVRARKQRLPRLPVGPCDPAEGPPDGLAWKEMLGILDDELNRLPDRHRAALVLCYLEGRTQDEAARQLGWSLNTLRRRLASGRRLLEARLRGRGVTLSAALAGMLASGAAAVPVALRDATLTAGLARAAGTSVDIAPALSGTGRGTAPLLPAPGKRFAALIAVAALGAAGCLAYCLAPPVEQGPTKNEPKAEVPLADAVAEPLPARAVVRLGTDRYRNGDPIASMSVSADGKCAIVAASWRSPGNARVFDLTDGHNLFPSTGGSSSRSRRPAVEAVGMSPDGGLLTVKDQAKVYFVRRNGERQYTLAYLTPNGGSRSITDWITFTPDGKHVAITLLGHAIQLIDTRTFQTVRTFQPDAAASACVFSPDGKWMATAGYDREDGVYFARLWDVATGQELRRFPAGNHPRANGQKRTLAFSPDGSTLASGGWGDGRLYLWEAATGKELKVIPGTGSDILSVAFTPDGKTVVGASDRVRFFDLRTGQERLRIDRPARNLAFSADGSVLTGAVTGAIYRWDTATGRQLTPAGQDSGVEQVLVAPGGRAVFTTDQEGNLYAWDAAGGKPPRRIAGGVERGFVASPDGKYLAWAVAIDSQLPDPAGRKWYQPASRVRLYDVAAGRVVDRLPGFPDPATVTGFLPDGKTLLTIGGMGVEDAVVRLWDVESGREQRSFSVAQRRDANIPVGRRSMKGMPFYTARLAAISPDGKTFAFGPDWDENLHAGIDDPVRLFDVFTGKAGPELRRPADELAVPNEAGTDEVLDLGLIRSNRKLVGHAGRDFSPDGRFLADWGLNPYGNSRMDHITVWDTATGRVVASPGAGPQRGSANAAFAPDGRTFAAASDDGAVRLWETASWTVRAQFRGHRETDRVTAVTFASDGRLFTGGLDTVVLGWDVRPPAGAGKGTLADAWDALAQTSAMTAFEAQGRFLAEPGPAVEWLSTRLRPATPSDPERIRALIADLDRADFATRERATAALKEQGPAAEAALREVIAQSPSAEARRRAEGVLKEWTTGAIAPRELRALRAVEVLEWVATKEARALLATLARGAPEARLTREAIASRQRLDGPK